MDENIKNWKEKNLANYLKKHGEYSLSHEQIEHIFDYLSSDETLKFRNRLYRMSVPDALKMADKWSQKLQNRYKKIKEKEDDLKGIKIVQNFDQGFYVAELQSQESYAREGHLMSHCVGGYYNKEESTIYSLRDKKNNPHATIEYIPSKQYIKQVKGKGNSFVVEKYHNMTIAFINELDFNSINSFDVDKFGACLFGNSLLKNDNNRQSVVLNKDIHVSHFNMKKPIQKYEVNGNLHIENIDKELSLLADKIIVYGDLIIENAPKLLRLCNTLVVYGDIEIINCGRLRTLAKESYKILGDALFEDCPNFNHKNFKIEGNVDIELDNFYENIKI